MEPVRVETCTVYAIRVRGKRPREFFDKGSRDEMLAATPGGQAEERHAVKVKGPWLRRLGITSGKTSIRCAGAAEAAEVCRVLTEEAACAETPEAFGSAMEPYRKKSRASTEAAEREIIEDTEGGYRIRGPAPLAASTSSRQGEAPAAWQIKLSWLTEKRTPITVTGDQDFVQDVWDGISDEVDKPAYLENARKRQSHPVLGETGECYRACYFAHRAVVCCWWVEGAGVQRGTKATTRMPTQAHADRFLDMLQACSTNAARMGVFESLAAQRADEPPGTSNTGEGASFCQTCIDEGSANPHVASIRGMCSPHYNKQKQSTSGGNMLRKSAHSVEASEPVTDEELLQLLAVARVVLFTNAHDQERGRQTYAGRRLRKGEAFGIYDIPIYGDQTHYRGRCPSTLYTKRLKSARLWLQEHVADFMAAAERGVRFVAAGEQAWFTLQDAYYSATDRFLGFAAPRPLPELIKIERIPYPTSWSGELVGRDAVQAAPGILGVSDEAWRTIVRGAHSASEPLIEEQL